MNSLQTVNYDVVSQNTKNLDKLLDVWIKFIDVGERSQKTYKEIVRAYFRYLEENGLPQTTDSVIYYRDHLRKHLKPSSVQLYMSVIRTFYRWTAQQGIFPNIADHIKGAKVSREHKRDCLSAEQVKELIDSIGTETVRDLRDRALIAVAATTGLRTISLAKAEIQDISSIMGVTVLRYQGKGHTDKDTYVKLSPKVERMIREYLRSRTDNQPALFGSLDRKFPGRAMNSQSISHIVKGRLREIGIDNPRITAHSLRVSACTINLLNGGSLEESQMLLDHADISTTMIYRRDLEKINSQAENRITQAIFG